MTKNNVSKIKETKATQCFSYEVTMLVHIIADNEATAKSQLDVRRIPGCIVLLRNLTHQRNGADDGCLDELEGHVVANTFSGIGCGVTSKSLEIYFLIKVVQILTF